MKYFFKGLLVLFCSFSSISLSATPVNDSTDAKHQMKLYFDANDVDICDNAIYVHLENTLIETNVIRTDHQGLYIFENDIADYEATREAITKEWKCPYCYHWWPVGQRCQNPKCPTNQW